MRNAMRGSTGRAGCPEKGNIAQRFDAERLGTIGEMAWNLAANVDGCHYRCFGFGQIKRCEPG